MVDGAVNVSKLLRLVEDEVLPRRIAAVHGLDNRIVQNWLDNPGSRFFTRSNR
jgi:hypothetical protein